MADIEKVLVGKDTYVAQTNTIVTAIQNAPVNQPYQYVEYIETTGNKIIFHNHANTSTEITLQGLPSPVLPDGFLHVNSATSQLEWVLGSGGGTTVVANPTLLGSEDALTGLQVGATKYKVPTAFDELGLSVVSGVINITFIE